MTYAGTTAGSTATNPPINVWSALSGGQVSGLGPAGVRNVWVYSSTHTGAECAVANFFTDAKPLGMAPNDLFFGITGSAGTTNPLHFRGVVCAPISTSGGQISSNISSGL